MALRTGGSDGKDKKLENPVWQRQSWETESDFHKFRTYRDTPIYKKRELKATARELDTNYNRLWMTAKENRWLERTLAYDRHEDAKRIKQINRGKIEMSENHIRIAKVMQELIGQRLKTMDVETLTARDIRDWAEVATKIERVARGESSDIVTHNVADGRESLITSAKEFLRQQILDYPDLSEKERAEIIKTAFGVEPHEVGFNPAILDSDAQEVGEAIN